jgi:hypothetical protein
MIVETKPKRKTLSIKQVRKFPVEENKKQPQKDKLSWHHSDPDFIRGFRVELDDGYRELLVRRDAISWIIACKDDPENKTFIGLRTAGSKPIPVCAPFDEIKEWWIAGRKAAFEAKAKKAKVIPFAKPASDDGNAA